MLIEGQYFEIKWSKSNFKHYTDKGYVFTKYNDTFKVSVNDLSYGSKIEVQVRCDYCGENYFASFYNYNKGHKSIFKDSCKKCVGRKCADITLSKRQEKCYKMLVNKSIEHGYELLSSKDEIINNETRIKYRCPYHGIQEMRIINYLSGKKCPHCSFDNLRKLYQCESEDIIKNIEKFGGTLLNVNDYINNQTKNLKILCPECKKEFITSYRAFIQHNGQICKECSRTSESNGERKIRHFLDEHHIEYVQEKWFSDCRDIKPLPFDFYIPSCNLIIEFDGRQHFGDTNYFSYTYDKVLLHDKIKDDYCRDKGIEIMRIPYWKHKNIDKILSNKLFT